LTDEKKALRLQACQEFIQSVDDDRSLLDSIVRGDETCCFQYDPEQKDNAWNTVFQALEDKKFRFQKSNKKFWEELIAYFPLI
jgi:hypothetical protein